MKILSDARIAGIFSVDVDFLPNSQNLKLFNEEIYPIVDYFVVNRRQIKTKIRDKFLDYRIFEK